MSVLFRYPNAGAPTSTLTFNSADVWIVEPKLFAIERINFAISGKAWYSKIGTAQPKRHTVQFIYLPEVDASPYSGYNSLVTFITTVIEFGRRTFDITDTDSAALTGVRLIGGGIELVEAAQRTKMKDWSGSLLFHEE